MWSNPIIIVPIAAMITLIIIVTKILRFLQTSGAADSKTEVNIGVARFRVEHYEIEVRNQRHNDIREVQRQFNVVRDELNVVRDELNVVRGELNVVRDEMALKRLRGSIKDLISALPKHLRSRFRTQLAYIDRSGLPQDIANQMVPLVIELVCEARRCGKPIPRFLETIASRGRIPPDYRRELR